MIKNTIKKQCNGKNNGKHHTTNTNFHPKLFKHVMSTQYTTNIDQ